MNDELRRHSQWPWAVQMGGKARGPYMRRRLSVKGLVGMIFLSER
jgi:hypothetical protein